MDMKKKNKKGFTLIELLATIVILTVVMSIGAYSVVNIIKHAQEKNYDLLIDNIMSGAEAYFQECEYVIDGDSELANDTGIECDKIDNHYDITLGELVRYGYIKGNSTDNKNKFTITNPKAKDANISNCVIRINYGGGTIIVTPVTEDDNCPKEYSKVVPE